MSEKKQLFLITGIESPATHLKETYGLDVDSITEVDRGVFRIDGRDGPSWVARVFPTPRHLNDIQNVAEILDHLERAGFPGERNAVSDSASTHEGQSVLVTDFIVGSRPKGAGRTFAYLGGLLGAGHSRDGHGVSAGAGWHRLVSFDTPNDEILARQVLLNAHAPAVTKPDLAAFTTLNVDVSLLDTCEDLPHYFVHPDMVPSNATEVDDGSLATVDWANAVRGPRLWSIGMALFAAGVRDIRMLGKFVSRYTKWYYLEPEELTRLDGVIGARPLTIHGWSVAYGRESLSETLPAIRYLQRTSAGIADSARHAFSLPRADP